MIEQKGLLDTLERIVPDTDIWREIRARRVEEAGRRLLLAGDREGALEKFRTCVKEKKAVFIERWNAAKSKSDAASVAANMRELARNYLGIAILERRAKRFDATRAACEAAIEILEQTETATEDEKARDESAAIREEAARLLENCE